MHKLCIFTLIFMNFGTNSMKLLSYHNNPTLFLVHELHVTIAGVYQVTAAALVLAVGY